MFFCWLNHKRKGKSMETAIVEFVLYKKGAPHTRENVVFGPAERTVSCGPYMSLTSRVEQMVADLSDDYSQEGELELKRVKQVQMG